ncbi:DUF6320 domain-containing protein [Pseudobutyrivibrio xylanivorans]|uniref:Zinc ribbon domain-containing protein n=1 Tax=Pseudobutyrivibrio xylanivorans TaxID=185007 RepID=A0A5P6VPG7_PSEXY|nr:DUF6320 domain-containing protein [Pseudobutyrivibrio xylanivorans]QFJ54575.1 hypothetical protein FXF36_06775 [Pseudobutyrivibrio xylanivorans]
MKNCPYCNIKVGGDLKKCPFCQSRLAGEAEDRYFPTQTILKLQSFFYKLQLFIVWIIIITSIGLDFFFGLPLYPSCKFHWSLLIIMWLLAFEFTIIRLFKKGMNASRVLSISVVLVMIMLGITAYYVGFLKIFVYWVLPNVVMATMVANFVFSMLDKSGNAMVYLLTNLLIGILPYIAFYVLKRNCPLEWIICLLVSFALFVGAIIFRGREVVNEIQRRLSV